MRDKRFIAEHRGGPLKREQHRQLIRWACSCSGNVIFLCGDSVDERLKIALKVALEWESGNATVGDARKAALGAIAVANKSSYPVSVAVARSIGHAVATAHMADHSLGAALYALKAVKLSGRPVDDERNWQNDQLPAEIRELVVSARPGKEKVFNL